jgi:hypothetical protein
MDSAFLVLFLLLAVFSGLNCFLECINFFEKEGQRVHSGSSFEFKSSLVVFLLFKFDNCSAISRVVIVLVTIVIPNVGTLMIFRRLAYTNGSRCKYSYFLLVVRKDWDRWCV